MDSKDFPGIAVRVRKPKLVLSREATGYVFFDLFEDAPI
jgi:hypothetical protein